MIRLLMIAITIMPLQSSNKRILAIYTKSTSDAAYKQQVQILNADKPGLAERNVIIETYVYNNTTAARFKQHSVKGSFTVTLTGKDGGEKHRSSQPIALQRLYGIIDAMPMRKYEMERCD